MKVQLSAAEEQCQTLQEDLECTEMSKDTLIQKAWDARDSAVKVKMPFSFGYPHLLVRYPKKNGISSLFSNSKPMLFSQMIFLFGIYQF